MKENKQFPFNLADPAAKDALRITQAPPQVRTKKE